MIRAGDKTRSRLHRGLRKAEDEVVGDGGLVLVPAAVG
jgi:hypothetical protein